MKFLFKLEKNDYFLLSEIRVFMYKSIIDMPKINVTIFENKISNYELMKLKKLNDLDFIFKEYFKELFVKTERLSSISSRHLTLIQILVKVKFSVNSLNIIYYYISNILIEKIKEKYGNNDEYNKYVIITKKILGSDLHLLSSSFYKEIEELKNKRRVSLDKDFFNIFNSSVSDKFNNYLLSFESIPRDFLSFTRGFEKFYISMLETEKDLNNETYKLLLTKFNKLNNIFSEKSKEIQEEKNKNNANSFFENYSKMFSGINSDYESEIDNKHLIYIIKYIIINGFKVKSIIVNDEFSEFLENKNFKIKIHEISLLKSLFVLILNASEHNSTKIYISSSIEEDNLYIDVTNNGFMIDEKLAIMLFEPFFTTKTRPEYIKIRKEFLLKHNILSNDGELNNECYGYGLNIAKEELNKFSSNVFLLKSNQEETTFRISLKIIKSEKNNFQNNNQN